MTLTDALPLPANYRLMPGRFSYSIKAENDLTFIWDSAAVTPEGDLILIEKELTAPVHMHIQGHIARAGFMLAAGERVRKLVWVVPARHFACLWSIVEPWRQALQKTLAMTTPPCEYWEPSGICLGISQDYR